MKQEGRHLSVQANGDELYRVTHRQDGRWLWCDRYGNHGGDNIDLVREIEPETGYAEAVYRLTGAPKVDRQKPEPSKTPLREIRAHWVGVCMPQAVQGASTRLKSRLNGIGEDAEHGRRYLKRRGISSETIEQAEKSGMVRYVEGGVLFVGYDRTGTAQNVTRRATAFADPVQKRDLRGSDKSYPPTLSGNPAKVWIVEGGMDALALHDLARRSGQQPPTVLVSGGANVRSFLERDDVQAILQRAERVTVAGENEKNPETQARTDAGHRKQMQRVAEITGREAQHWKPKPEQGKDLADLNARQVAGIEARRQAELEAKQAQRSRERDRGMSR